jgi:hypothetical protein
VTIVTANIQPRNRPSYSRQWKSPRSSSTK